MGIVRLLQKNPAVSKFINAEWSVAAQGVDAARRVFYSGRFTTRRPS